MLSNPHSLPNSTDAAEPLLAAEWQAECARLNRRLTIINSLMFSVANELPKDNPNDEKIAYILTMIAIAATKSDNKTTTQANATMLESFRRAYANFIQTGEME